MSMTRITYFTADRADRETLLSRRAALIDAVRAGYPGLAETRLSRLDDEAPGTAEVSHERWVDVWRWDSAADARAATEGAPALPEVGAAFALTRDVVAHQGLLVDEC